MASTTDLHWIMQGTMYPLILYAVVFYLHLEGHKYFLKPVFSRWYRSIINSEIHNYITYYKESQHIDVQKNLDFAKEQIEYFDIHEEYNKIKADSINRFLANEEVNLKNHIHERTVAILEGAKKVEDINKRNIINEIVKSAVEEFERIVKNVNDKDIQSSFFDLALTGIEKGVMTYENDYLLNHMKKFIKEKIEKINGLSSEEQKKLVALTEVQLNNLKLADEKSRDDYLSKEPMFDPSLKSDEKVKKLLKEWGN